MSPSEPIINGTDDGNRRSAERRNLLESHMATASLGPQGSALILDLSEAGLGVQSVGGLEVGSSLPVRFNVPEADLNVEGTGKIAWSDGSGRAGVSLDGLSEASREALKNWTSSNGQVNPAPAPASADPIAEAQSFIQTQKLASEVALDYLVQQTANITFADGAAIALHDGSGMVCRASVGSAPGVGVRLKGSSGLTGECVQTRQVIRCDDTETDPRADRLLCRRINLRSTLIVPVMAGTEMIGVVETLSSRARAFDSDHVLLLRRMADLVAATVAKNSTAVAVPMASILEPSAAPVTTARDPLEGIFPLSWAPGVCDICGTQNDKAATACARCGAPLQVAEAPTSKPQTEALPSVRTEAAAPSVAAIPVVKAAPVARPAAPPTVVPTPKPAAQPVTIAPALGAAAAAAPAPVKPATIVSMPQPVMAARPANTRKPLMITMVAVVALAIAGATYEYLQLRKAVPAAKPQQAPVAALTAPAPTPIPTLPAEPAATKPAGAPAVTASTAASAPRPEPASATPRPATPAPLQLRTPQKQAADAGAAAPPTVTAASGNAPTLVPLSTTAPAMPQPVLRVSGKVVQPKLVQRVNPSYPDMARRIGLEGEVHIAAVVNAQGKITNAHAVSGPDLLRSAALDAVKQWKYEAGSLDGQAIDTDINIIIQFHLPRSQ